MSLITYIEPMNVGSIFIGLSSLIAMFVFVFIIFKIAKPVWKFCEHFYYKEIKYSILEEKILYDLAKEKGIDIEEELLKRNVLEKERKSFRNKIEEEVFDKMFPETKKK